MEQICLLVIETKASEEHWVEKIEALVYWFMYLIISFIFNPYFFTTEFRMAIIVPREVQ